MTDRKKKTTTTTKRSRSKKGATPAPADHDAIARVAYFKWEQAGRPVSDGLEFWLAAEAENTRANVDMVEITD